MRTTPNGVAWTYWRVSYGFDVRFGDPDDERDWKVRVLDYGPTYIAGGKRRQFLTSEGYSISWFLNEDGTGQDPSNPAGVVPHYQEFNAFPKKSWTPLNLPTNLSQCKPTLVSV
jgi:hypothetical protein